MPAHGGKSAEQCRNRDDDPHETAQRATPSPIPSEISIPRRLREAGFRVASPAQAIRGSLGRCRNGRQRGSCHAIHDRGLHQTDQGHEQVAFEVAKQPDVSRDTDYYPRHIGKVKSIDDFLKDYRLYSYAMKAYGLSDMTYAKAFMRKVLTEGVSDKQRFRQQADATARYREFATAFNFACYGANATQTSAATTGTAT